MIDKCPKSAWKWLSFIGPAESTSAAGFTGSSAKSVPFIIYNYMKGCDYSFLMRDFCNTVCLGLFLRNKESETDVAVTIILISKTKSLKAEEI